MDRNDCVFTGILKEDARINKKNGRSWAVFNMSVNTDGHINIIEIRTQFLSDDYDFSHLIHYKAGEKVTVSGELRVSPSGRFYIRAKDYERVAL